MAAVGDLLSLASVAAQTLISAATGDAWQEAKKRFARLLGRGDRHATELAEERLQQVREQMVLAPAESVAEVRRQLEIAWLTRLLDLLEESPGAAGDLKLAVDFVQAQLPDALGAVSGHVVAAGRDLSVTASLGGVAAGMIQGNVALAGTAVPGQNPPALGPGATKAGAPGLVHADRGGVAIGRMEYQRSHVPSRTVRLPLRPALLAGREEALAELSARLSPADGETPRVVALCGLGGVGKSSLAADYAHRKLASLDVVWWFAAEEAASLTAGFGDLAAQLGIRGLLDTGDPVAQVHGALAAWPGQWLLIFDNAPDLAAVQKVMPPAGNGQVLITTQSPYWPGRQAMELAVLGLDAAAGFLLDRTGSVDQATAAELAAELGGLPLALEQAAAYMQATGRGLADYLETFRQRRDDLLSRGEPIGYDRQVATTWTLAFDQLHEDTAGSIDLLRLLACCAPEQIPVDILLRRRPQLAEVLPGNLAALLSDPISADDAVASLRRFSLVGRPQAGRVSVHRLVQAVTLGRLSAIEAATWKHAARLLIESALPSDASQPASWADFAALLPHAEVALQAGSDGMTRLVDFLGYRSNYAAARDLQQKIVSALAHVHGQDHPDTLAAQARLNALIGAAGDPAHARDRFASLIPVLGRVLGAEHADTLFARANLARWTSFAGDRTSARDQFAALVEINEQAFGPEDPRTLFVRANLALQTAAAGDAKAARDQFTALVPAMERVLGPEHPDTLYRRINLGSLTGEAGDPTAARDLFALLLPVLERVLGADYPDTLQARFHLATWTGEAGDAASARDQLTALLPLDRQIHGEDHPETLKTRACLARWTGASGDAASARGQYAALLPALDHVLGKDHPTTVAARVEFATWTAKPGHL